MDLSAMKIKKFKKDIRIKKIFFNNKGQSTVEFVLLIPFLIITCIAVFQLGYVIYIENNIKQLSREAARVVATTNSNNLCAKIIKDNNNLYKDLNFQIIISPDTEAGRKVGDIVKIGIKINYEGFGGLIKNIFGKPISIYSESIMRMECE
ncbi:MAG: TadE/TadG family type IV pilus assembly protein [Candidatus Humimicrobiaceae bacterium]